MEKIWGYDTESEIDVVWTHIGYVRKKLRGIGADAEIKTIGGRNVVAAEGSAGDTPGAVYVLGRGKTVVVLNFAGTNAVSAAETVIASMEFK